MSNKNDALIIIAKEVVEKSSEPLSISKIAEEVFKIKGTKASDADIIQFGIDFMLSGDFVCCGNKGNDKVWDLKNRQPSSILDDDIIEDLQEDDEEVKKNELKEENINPEDIDNGLDANADVEDEEESDEKEEKDDIEEALGLSEEDGEDNIEMIEIDDEDEEDEDEEEFDIDDIEGTIKQ
ncbi:MAG: hypothetical protein J5691_06425 [Bacilli bacterium]|nr:hypothetical protein [Bacilli bacterium]